MDSWVYGWMVVGGGVRRSGGEERGGGEVGKGGARESREVGWGGMGWC